MIPQFRGAIPKIVFVSDIVRFLKPELEAAVEQAAQEDAQQANMNAGNSGNKIPGIRAGESRMVNNTFVYGSPQNTNQQPDNPHALAVEAKMQELAASGDYEFIGMDVSWRTMTGRDNTCRNRPDIIARRRDGSIFAVEVASPRQDTDLLDARMDAAISTWQDGVSSGITYQTFTIQDILGQP